MPADRRRKPRLFVKSSSKSFARRKPAPESPGVAAPVTDREQQGVFERAPFGAGVLPVEDTRLFAVDEDIARPEIALQHRERNLFVFKPCGFRRRLVDKLVFGFRSSPVLL